MKKRFQATRREIVRNSFLVLTGFSLLLVFSCSKEVPDIPRGPASFPEGAIALPDGVSAEGETPHQDGGIMAEINRYKERLNSNPNDLAALIFLGNANFDIRRYEPARDFYIRALAIDPKNPQVRTDLASCYRHLGETDLAVSELRTTLLLTPDHPEALYNLGVVLLNDKGDRPGAKSAWERLVQTHRGHPLAEGLPEKIKEITVADKKGRS